MTPKTVIQPLNNDQTPTVNNQRLPSAQPPSAEALTNPQQARRHPTNNAAHQKAHDDHHQKIKSKYIGTLLSSQTTQPLKNKPEEPSPPSSSE
ncbi:hypothetical protein [Corynebacterium lactis]|uniref:hypothetical protein n=1 Tax=Corynebacterium lactis TaxID=1231000 RepID=UPI0012E1AB35|nr:hypothetical protein [Corynebacterium lactis]